jgi:hypothetical protein
VARYSHGLLTPEHKKTATALMSSDEKSMGKTKPEKDVHSKNKTKQNKQNKTKKKVQGRLVVICQRNQCSDLKRT